MFSAIGGHAVERAILALHKRSSGSVAIGTGTAELVQDRFIATWRDPKKDSAGKIIVWPALMRPSGSRRSIEVAVTGLHQRAVRLSSIPLFNAEHVKIGYRDRIGFRTWCRRWRRRRSRCRIDGSRVVSTSPSTTCGKNENERERCQFKSLHERAFVVKKRRVNRFNYNTMYFAEEAED